MVPQVIHVDTEIMSAAGAGESYPERCHQTMEVFTWEHHRTTSMNGELSSKPCLADPLPFLGGSAVAIEDEKPGMQLIFLIMCVCTYIYIYISCVYIIIM